MSRLHACCRKLGKKVQTELAGANAVADEALTNIATVRAHAAEDSARAGYAAKLQDFYGLQVPHLSGLGYGKSVLVLSWRSLQSCI